MSTHRATDSTDRCSLAFPELEAGSGEFPRLPGGYLSLTAPARVSPNGHANAYPASHRAADASVWRRNLLIGLLALAGCNSKPSGEHEESARQDDKKAGVAVPGQEQVGQASWYGPDFEGKKTASGDLFKPDEMTAASPSLPLGSKAEVTNLQTGKKAQVEITDRGPYVRGRAIDLSQAAAQKLGITKKGTARVKIKLKSTPKKHPSTRRHRAKRRTRH